MLSRDVRVLLAILDAEGFGLVAGEILTEIEAGRPIARGDGGGRADRMPVGHDGRIPDDLSEDEAVRREPLPEGEQLAAAVSMLRLRLVEPARRLAEAEREAGRLMDRGPVPFALVDDGMEDGEPVVGEPGDDRLAIKLGALLAVIGDEDPQEEEV